ncbi:tape measure protein [Acinetobacter johnsonii]|uniref:tape measure protein n=1 Tax=Acinetobacter johnsonii TaxID=40214 RepID=UPI00280FA421|nr:tape measure protein [Acinetobacter johnsonii]MDQ8974622.1 tape measure protein [Acinetobacter johnsonii]
MAQDSVLRIVIDSRNAERNARNVANELQNIERNGDHASQSMDSMSVATRQLAGYMAGVVTVGAAIGKMDAYTGMQNRLKLVTESQEQLNLAMSNTFSIAQKTRSSWENVIQVYQRFQDNAKTLNIDMAKTAELTETVSKAVAISGASTEGANAALVQFGQSLASGVFRGEEFNSVAEQAPGLLKAIATGLGVNIGQLRAMANDGKLTSDILVDALTKSKKSVDELFAKTDVTIGQSLQLLSNEVTKFTGEAGKASGVATTLASSIQVLANNLDVIAGIAVVGGVALLTKTIAAQTVAIHGSITAVVARRAADTAALQSQIQLTAVEVQRTRQVAALGLTEINLARQELNSATTRQARAAATMRLTQAEIAHSIALKQSAAAVATQTAAENALNASRSRGAMLLGLVGGPIGALTIGVTALAAGYMLLSNNSQESTKSLRENNGAVGDAIVKYRELNGIQRDAQMAAERQKLDELNEAYRKASTELMVYASNMGSMGEVVTESQVELSKLFAEYKKTGDLDKFNTSVQNSSKVSQDAKDKTANFAKAVFEAGSASKTQKEFIAQLSGELNSTANAGNNAAAGVRNLASALSEVNTKLSSDVFSAKLQNAFEKQGKSSQSAARWTEVYNENAKKGFKGVTVAQKKMLDELDAVDKQREARQKAAQASASASTKASKAALTQQKKDVKEANRIDEEQRNLREQYIYAYADREKQIELNLAKEIAEIHKANFSNPEPYLEAANKRAYYEKQIYLSQLQFEINEFQMSEEQKLKYSYDIKNLQLHQNSEITKESKEIAINALEEQYNQELSYIKLAKEQRIFQAEQGMYSEMELIQKRYAFELQEIAKVQDADERSRLLNAASFNKKESENDLTKSLTSDYMNVMGLEENPLIQQFEVLNKLRENDLINEEAYQNAKLELQAKSTAGYMEGMLGGFASLVDENSKTYAVLFAAQKAFAVAQAMLNIPAAYSKAYDAVVGTPYIGPYIAPAVGAAAAALQVAQAASIKSTNMSGFKSGGYTGNIGLNQEAGVVHGQEYVLNAAATRRVGINTLNAINNGGTIQAERQAQASAKVQSANPQPIDNQIRVAIFDDRADMMNQMYGREGEKVVMYHLKRNGMLKA